MRIRAFASERAHIEAGVVYCGREKRGKHKNVTASSVRKLEQPSYLCFSGGNMRHNLRSIVGYSALPFGNSAG